MIDQALVAAEFTDATELAEQFARLAPGHSLTFCVVASKAASWRRHHHPSASLVQGWIDGGAATVAGPGADPVRPGKFRHILCKTYDADRAAPVPGLRSTLAFEASDEGRVWALLRDCAAAGQPCPSNEAIAEALDLETAREARSLFDRLKAQGRVRVISAAQFSHRVIEVIEPGAKDPLRTAPCGGAI